MKTLERLEQLAFEHHTNIYEFDVPECKSMSVKIDGKKSIAICRVHCASESERTVHLAHEMGHCETESFYNMYAVIDDRGKCEQIAKEWAIKKLMPPKKFITAVKHGCRTPWDFAERFAVTCEFAAEAMEYYRNDSTVNIAIIAVAEKEN